MGKWQPCCGDGNSKELHPALLCLSEGSPIQRAREHSKRLGAFSCNAPKTESQKPILPQRGEGEVGRGRRRHQVVFITNPLVPHLERTSKAHWIAVI